MQTRQLVVALLGVVLVCVAANTAIAQTPRSYMTVPARDQYTHQDTAGITVLPSGRFLTPAGQTIRIAHDPFGMAISPDGSKTITLQKGVFTIIDNASLKSTMVGWYSKIPSPLSSGSF